MAKRFALRLGALAPSITEQLDNQGIEYAPQNGKIWNKARDSIVYLRVHNFVPESEASKIEKRLIKDISNNAMKGGE